MHTRHIAAVAERLELVHGPAPTRPNEVELTEALRCWHVLLSALRDDRRKQRAPSLSSPPPPSPDASATTEHASRKRTRVVAAAEGLALVPSSGGDTGFKGVFIGAERAAAEAAEARVEKPQPLMADETGLANGLRRSADGRVWNALGTQLCAKDGCTKPAWHSGICVSVLGYRRDQKRVQMYTAEPAPGPRERMRQAGEKRRLPPSEKPKLGDHVRGKYQGQIGGRNWYDGVVTAVHEDGTCNLHYDDGDYEERVAPRFIRVIAEEEIEEEIEEAEEEAEPEEPEEAASCYARHIGAERAAAEAFKASVAGPRPLTADEARAAAVAEGLELVPSSSGQTGFKRVKKSRGRYVVTIYENGKTCYLGTFATPEEAALCYARHVGAERAAAEAAEASVAGPRPLTADEARAAAVAEGLELVPSSSGQTGFKGVRKKDGRYDVLIRENGKQRYIGTFATPEEAALCYARRVGAERAAAEAAEASVAGPRPLTADEARAAAVAEGLELVPSSSGQTGFKRVKKSRGRYVVTIYENGKTCYLGTFATPEEAALCYARHVGAERAAAEAAEASVAGPRPLTADEARAAAAAEGLELVPSSRSETGFKGVRKSGGRFEVLIRENGKQRYISTFATPEEAALCYARHVGAERAATEAAEARDNGQQPLTADEARAAAAAEGLELVPSASGQTGFRGVTQPRVSGRYVVMIYENGKPRYIGTFATPEEAALCYARHVGAERAATEAAEARDNGQQPLTADEARAAAAAEGLELVPSSSGKTGFRGVFKYGGKYKVLIRENGKPRYLGGFATPEEAALCCARHRGAKRAATVAPEARGRGQRPLTVDDARAAAAAEGLELVPSSGNVTGFKGVLKAKRKYVVVIRENGKQRHLGRFATPEEAALCYARYIGPERAAAEAAEARVAAPQPLTADEARAAAAAEGLELVPSSSGKSGFKGVTERSGRYDLMAFNESGKRVYLGTFATPEEAALCYARHIGADRAAAEARQPLTADEARAAAAVEGLELVPSSRSQTGFKGVTEHSGRYQMTIMESGKKRHFGSFATPEEAALCYARHIGAERAAAEAAEASAAAPRLLTADDARAAAVAEGLELVHAPAPSGPNEVELAEALRCWRVLLSALRDDRRKQRAPSLSSPPPPSPDASATTEHASRKRLAAAVACAEVLQRAVALQPQLTAESGDDPGAARCIICLVALDLRAASSRGEAACGHAPCCGNYYHKRCLSRWLQGFGESDDDPLPIEKNCPTCRQALSIRALIPGLSRRRLR